MGIVVILVGTALLVPLLARHDPVLVNMSKRLLLPNAEHLLGTDGFGRDVLARLLFGARVSLRIGLFTGITTAVAGTLLGLVAGYYRFLDGLIMRTMDGLMAIPAILLALAFMAVLGPKESNAIIALSIVYTPPMTRIVRASVLVIREMEYIQAARALGCGDLRLMFRHILPQCASPIIVQAAFTFSYAVLSDAILSFLGAGPPPPTPSWGSMLAEARDLIWDMPTLALYPGLAVTLAVLGFNLLGDGIRDLIDPRGGA